MYKKIVPVILLSVALTACGSANKEATPATESNTVATNESATTTAPTTATEETVAENPDVQIADAVEMKTYKADDFSINYPASWVEYDTTAFNQPSIKVAFNDPAPKVQFADNVNVTVNAIDANTTIKQVVNTTLAYYEQDTTTMPNFNLITNEQDAIQNHAVIIGEYTQPQTKVAVILTQLIVVTQKKLYTLSISMSQNNYDNGGQEQVAQMIESFSFADNS
ncbi:hypothetical protein QE450_000499 [Paenibacillus sp. SORGH_AS306]|uniref:PsbP-related protein n=1 Tax=unclassified Paenibacillus TaxID=185978 RepID=UPI00277FD9F7|nr:MULTISPECIES: PsbP-related protein [unclassified Paenibacillus]MDQ1233001.1 hypothetical protein [Paenibacillus sp. SORGH_AS_0306]MDR6110046.1 hypothetical protein [Paenibacillus sp. SORGH_AS_0338]